MYLKGLEIVKSYCGSAQVIHLHCFGGNCEVVAAWATAFSRCYFVFTKSFLGQGKIRLLGQFLLNVYFRNLILHIYHQTGTRINNPLYLGDIAGEVAARKGISATDLLKATTENGRRAYFL